MLPPFISVLVSNILLIILKVWSLVLMNGQDLEPKESND
jgi:hypothetical protein